MSQVRIEYDRVRLLKNEQRATHFVVPRLLIVIESRKLHAEGLL